MIPNDAIVYLQMACKGLELAVGTGVLYRRAKRTYIVTAWHNVTGRNSDTLDALSRDAIFPDRLTASISCRMTSLDGKSVGSVRMAFDIPLEDEERTFYLVHPQGWPRVDVVAIPIDPDYGYPTVLHLSDGETIIKKHPMVFEPSQGGLGSSIACIQDFAGASAQFDVDFARYLTVSDDLFIVGYPLGITDQMLQPLWKRATVATVPALGWQGQKMFLVDCASRKGMSGAPVMTFSKSGNLQVGGMTYVGDPATLLHGIYVGRQAGAAEFEAQIGTVWKREVIDEVIDAALPAPRSNEIEASNVEIREHIRASWPARDEFDFADAVVNLGRPTGYFSHQLAERLNGRASFKAIDKMVKEEAELRCRTNEQS